MIGLPSPRWDQSTVPDHRNRFESAAPNDGDYDGDAEDDGFAAYEFELDGQTVATTEFDAAIESAIRATGWARPLRNCVRSECRSGPCRNHRGYFGGDY